MNQPKLPLPSNSEIDWESLAKEIREIYKTKKITFFTVHAPIEPPIRQIYNCVSGIEYPRHEPSFLILKEEK